jgi:hypothetical protein
VPFCVAHQLIADMSLTTGSVVWEIGCGVVRFAAVISAVTGSVVYCSEVHDVYKYLMGIAETLRGAFPKSTYVPLCEALSKCPAAATADYDQRMVAGTFPANTSFVDELEKCLAAYQEREKHNCPDAVRKALSYFGPRKRQRVEADE